MRVGLVRVRVDAAVLQEGAGVEALHTLLDVPEVAALSPLGLALLALGAEAEVGGGADLEGEELVHVILLVGRLHRDAVLLNLLGDDRRGSHGRGGGGEDRHLLGLLHRRSHNRHGHRRGHGGGLLGRLLGLLLGLLRGSLRLLGRLLLGRQRLALHLALGDLRVVLRTLLGVHLLQLLGAAALPRGGRARGRGRIALLLLLLLLLGVRHLPLRLECEPLGGGLAEVRREPLQVRADLLLLRGGERLDSLLVLRENLRRPLGPGALDADALRLLLLLTYLAAHREDGGVDLLALLEQLLQGLGGGRGHGLRHLDCLRGLRA